MGPVGHAVISTVVGSSVWGLTGSPIAGAVAAGVGVLVDVDHLVDLYQSWIRRRTHLVIVPFHGWEYSLVGLVIMSFFFHSPMFIGEGLRKMQSHTHPALQLFARAMISPHDK